jgi:hypothetical protein
MMKRATVESTANRQALINNRLILAPHHVIHSEAGRRTNLRLALEQILAAGRGEVPVRCANPEVIPRWRGASTRGRQ